MLKKYNGPGGYYFKEIDLGPDPFSSKMMDNPFNTEQFYKESWDRPEMRGDYRELNFANESLSPKEFAGAGEMYEDSMYKQEAGPVSREDPYAQPKTGSESENFGMKDTKFKKKESKRRSGMD